MKLHIIFFIVILFATGWINKLQSQSGGERYLINGEVYTSSMKFSPDYFIPELLQNAVLDEINKMRLKNYVEPLEVEKVLFDAAKDQAIYMAQNNIDKIERKEKEKAATEERLIFYGASKNAFELVEKTTTNKSGEYFSYYKISYDIVFNWFSSSKTKELLLSKEFVFTGIACASDNTGENVYISLVLGNYNSFNDGASQLYQSDIPVTEKVFGIKPYDERECKKLDKYNNLSLLQNGLKVENNIIYFEYPDERFLKRIFRNKKDGLLIDLVQKKQYACNSNNLIDNNLINKGIILDKIYAKKLFKNNVAQKDDSIEFRAMVAALPENINSEFELNLILVQNKHTCINLSKSFIITGNEKYERKVELLADTITINSEFAYQPSSDTCFLTFKIPFEKRKYTFKPKDIQPLIDSLNEPAFQIHELNIAAYSSVEGTEEINKMLQQKRAESIIDAIKKLTRKDIITNIYTADNWDAFKEDIVNTKYSSLAKMPIVEAQNYLNKINLDEELENILSKHRYAQVDMKITYYIKGEYEQDFVLSEFNKAIQNNDLPLALSIQKFIFTRVLKGKYDAKAVYEQQIPYEIDFAGLLMNKTWLEKFISKNPLSDFYSKIEELYALNGTNAYIKFNYVYIQLLKNNFKNFREVQNIQNIIDELYFSTFTKKTVDDLNVKFQLQVLERFENDEKIVEESLGKLKNIIDIRDENSIQALRLAYLFMKFKDFDYAFKLLDPFVLRSDTSEDFIFTYLSLCSHKKERTYSNRFLAALEKANSLNHERFCELFNGDYFSFQVFDNFKAKEFYCKECK